MQRRCFRTRRTTQKNRRIQYVHQWTENTLCLCVERCVADLCAGTFAGSVPEPACTCRSYVVVEPEKPRKPHSRSVGRRLRNSRFEHCSKGCLGDNHLRSRGALGRQGRNNARIDALGIKDAGEPFTQLWVDAYCKHGPDVHRHDVRNGAPSVIRTDHENVNPFTNKSPS